MQMFAVLRQADVERLISRDRVHVVQGRVAVGEANLVPFANGDRLGNEPVVLLVDLHDRRSLSWLQSLETTPSQADERFGQGVLRRLRDIVPAIPPRPRGIGFVTDDAGEVGGFRGESDTGNRED